MSFTNHSTAFLQKCPNVQVFQAKKHMNSYEHAMNPSKHLGVEDKFINLGIIMPKILAMKFVVKKHTHTQTHTGSHEGSGSQIEL